MNAGRSNATAKAKGFSLIELLIVVAIILVISAIAVPSLLRSRMQANQTAAVATLRSIRNAETTYLITYPTQGFANTLSQLGPGVPCSQTAACMVDEWIGCAAAPCPKSGYKYFLVSSAAAAPFPDFSATATPIGFGSSGSNNYCVNDDGVIRSQIAPAASVGAVPRATCSDTSQYQAIQ